MNEGYTKLFGSIVTSSIWVESDQTRIVWFTLLALANRDGVIEGSVPGLASLARVSLQDTEDALDKLMSPDPYSRTKTHEGRRIEAVEGGWRLLNYAVYREKLSQVDRREQDRLRKQRYRQSKSGQGEDRPAVSRDVPGLSHDVPDKSAVSAHTDTDTDTETKKESTIVDSKESRAGNRFFTVTREEWDVYAKEIGLDDPGAPWDYYVSNGWKISGRAPMKDWKSALRNWKRNESKFGRKPFKPESRESSEDVFVKPLMP